MAKTFKQFYLKDNKKAENQIKAADNKNQEKRAARYFKEEDVPFMEDDIPLDEDTYKKYLTN